MNEYLAMMLDESLAAGDEAALQEALGAIYDSCLPDNIVEWRDGFFALSLDRETGKLELEFFPCSEEMSLIPEVAGGTFYAPSLN